MSFQQPGQSEFCNGYGRRKSEKEGATKSENKTPPGKINASRLASTGEVTGSKGGSYESLSHDRLVYVTTCLIGQQVEVHVKNGSIYSGIFHAKNTDKDFGIILKMARLTKDGSSQGQKTGAEFFNKAPSKILTIPAKELVQVIAQGVAVTRNGLPSESHLDRHQEIMVDSLISQSHCAELGRELKPWVPDEDDLQLPELENIFDGHWNRGWNQFETNESLFGVKSTFNEELYTTKLEKGPQTSELEKQALRIAREIEGEVTQDLHLAEERGLHLVESFDIDEETRFSSVYRGNHADDSGYEENEDILLDSLMSVTFSGMFGSVDKRSGEINGGKGYDGACTLANPPSRDQLQPAQSSTGLDLSRSGGYYHAKQLASEIHAKSYSPLDGESRIQENLVNNLHGVNGTTNKENLVQGEGVQLSKSDKDSQTSLYLKKDGSEKGVLSPNARSYVPYRPGLSPNSSVGSSSSEKSTLNPNAKEFKLNPSAMSFIPSPAARPPTPVSDSSFYFPSNVTAAQNMQGMPMSIGTGPTFAGPQPIMYNPQVVEMPTQAAFHPNAMQYGQLLGHPRQALYMPSYLPEMPYKGRDY